METRSSHLSAGDRAVYESGKNIMKQHKHAVTTYNGEQGCAFTKHKSKFGQLMDKLLWQFKRGLGLYDSLSAQMVHFAIIATSLPSGVPFVFCIPGHTGIGKTFGIERLIDISGMMLADGVRQVGRKSAKAGLRNDPDDGFCKVEDENTGILAILAK